MDFFPLCVCVVQNFARNLFIIWVMREICKASVRPTPFLTPNTNCKKNPLTSPPSPPLKFAPLLQYNPHVPTFALCPPPPTWTTNSAHLTTWDILTWTKPHLNLPPLTWISPPPSSSWISPHLSQHPLPLTTLGGGWPRGSGGGSGCWKE